MLVPEVRTPGSVASYSCSDGLMLTGDGVRVCGGDGMWNGTEPTCLGWFSFDYYLNFDLYTLICLAVLLLLQSLIF